MPARRPARCAWCLGDLGEDLDPETAGGHAIGHQSDLRDADEITLGRAGTQCAQGEADPVTLAAPEEPWVWSAGNASPSPDRVTES